MSASSTEQATAVLEALRRDVLSTPSGEEAGDAVPHAGQWPFLLSEAPRRDLRAHRRLGKNWACIWDAFGYNLTNPETGERWMGKAWRLAEEKRPNLNPKVVVWFVFPTYLLADELWTDLKAMMPAALVERTINSKPYRMELRGGIHVHVRSAERPEDLVSAGIDLLYMVEAARLKETAWLTIRPTLASHGRLGHVAFNSTPKGQNWYARLEERTLDPERPNWEGWKIPAFDPKAYEADDLRDETRHPMSAIPSTEKILEQREENRESWFDQEFMVEALAGEGQVFREVKAHLRAAPKTPRVPVVGGVDLAKRADFSVFSAFDAVGRQVGLDRMHGIPYPQQAERLAAFCHDHGLKKVVIETNGPGEVFIDDFKQLLHDIELKCEVIGMATTMQSKSSMINALALAFERSGEVWLMPDPVQQAEFEAYEETKTPADNVRYGAPEGQHDDTVMAAALAWTEVKAQQKRGKGTTPKRGQFSGLRKKSYMEERDGRRPQRKTSARSQSARLRGVRIARSR